jgi:hypothetical protein
MDEKKVIAKLAAIVANQQKIIMKLAQTQGLPPDSLPTSSVNVGGGHEMQTGGQPPPDKLDPNKVQKEPAKVFYEAMNPGQRGLLAFAPKVQGSDMQVSFKPGKATQPNYDSLLGLLKNLTTQNKIQQAYALKVV